MKTILFLIFAGTIASTYTFLWMEKTHSEFQASQKQVQELSERVRTVEQDAEFYKKMFKTVIKNEENLLKATRSLNASYDKLGGL